MSEHWRSLEAAEEINHGFGNALCKPSSEILDLFFQFSCSGVRQKGAQLTNLIYEKEGLKMSSVYLVRWLKKAERLPTFFKKQNCFLIDVVVGKSHGIFMLKNHPPTLTGDFFHAD